MKHSVFAEEAFGVPGGIVLRIRESDIPSDRNVQIHDEDLESYPGEQEHAGVKVETVTCVVSQDP
jgi:hypothetical protein